MPAGGGCVSAVSRAGSWGFTVDVGKDAQTGRRRQVTRSGFGTRPAAEQALSDEVSRLRVGVWVDDRDLTVGSWLQIWLLLQERAGRSAKTLTNYRGHVRDAWHPCLGEGCHFTIVALTSGDAAWDDHVRGVRDARVAAGRGNHRGVRRQGRGRPGDHHDDAPAGVPPELS
jgi:hypothetical protein